MDSITIRFNTAGDAYSAHLSGPAIGDTRGDFDAPFSVSTWSAILRALAPNYRPDAQTEVLLAPLGDRSRLAEHAGRALADALLADEAVRTQFEVALGMAMKARRTLPVELRFGDGCDAIAALPWELLHHQDHFLVAGGTIALSRYPEGHIPPTRVQADLPLRVLLVLSEPLDAGPTLSQQARHELLHGLRRLDEQGAVIVDVLRPPTFQMLTEALTTGEHHLLVFYGHGVYHQGHGHLLFEDEYGGRALVRADELGNIVRNSDVRLVVLGACESAAVAEPGAQNQQAAPDVWSGTAPALVRAGVPLAVGMQVVMRVDAALAFFRQFALSIAAGKDVIEAVGDARKPLVEGKYDHAWFIPALYGRPSDESGDPFRLFDPDQALPPATADVRQNMQTERREIERLEAVVAKLGTVDKPGEIATLRAAKQRYAEAHMDLARRTPGGYAPVVSPLYGVPSNPVFVGRHDELIAAGQGLKVEHPVVLWGAGGMGKSALAMELAHR